MKRSGNVLLGAVAASGLLFASGASATPVFDLFGPLPQATFGGTGIPNDEVAAGIQIVDGDTTITVAMSATQRFSNPALTNDGAGTYFAGPGSNFGGAGQSSSEGALWNFNYYIEVDGPGKTVTDYQFDLYYDFDTGLDTPIGSLGRWDLTTATLLTAPTATVIEDSQNLNFGFLDTGFPFVVFPPAGSFDPNALGEYNFAIQVTDPNSGFSVETVAIDVQVVPEPTSLALLALGGLALARRRR